MNKSNNLNTLEGNEIYVPPNCHVQPMSKHSEKWNKMFHALVVFKRKNGHCLVPNRYHVNPQLGLWVAVQRRQYRQYQRKESTVMTTGRVRLLESIGFKWSLKGPDHVPWDTRFQELQKYQQQHGDCMVPLGYKENPQLSVWVMLQRDAYRTKMEGKAKEIEDYQVMKLDSIGFKWDTEDDFSGQNQSKYDNGICSGLKSSPMATEIIRDTSNQSNEHASKTLPLNIPAYQGPQESQVGAVLPCISTANNFSPEQMKISRRSLGNCFQVEQVRSQYQNLNIFAQMNSIENMARMSLAKSMLQMQCLTRQRNPQLPYSLYSNLVCENLPNVTAAGNYSQAINDFLLQDSGGMRALSRVQDPCNQQKRQTTVSYNSIHNQLCRIVSQEEQIGVDRTLEVLNTSTSSPPNQKKIKCETKTSGVRRYPGPQTSDAFWWSRFAELQKFREKNGHCFVPNRYPVHPALGNWVSTQRRTYKLWKKNKNSSMNKERARALESIGFSWDATSSSNIDFYSEIERF